MHDYCIRPAGPEDLDGARAVMLDTVYREFGTGYVPRWHRDIIDPVAAYLVPDRHLLLVALDGGGGEVVATAALDSRGPAHPPNPPHVAERYPCGTTAQLRRVYVRREHRRRGLARRLVGELLAFAAADAGYRSAYLHTDPAVEGAESFWRSLGTVVHDERDRANGGQGIVHFDVPLPASRPRPVDACAPNCAGTAPSTAPGARHADPSSARPRPTGR
ncbi:GNAT family N-acetyltransferase [Streptomyces sp. NPDC051445]|uniref:GNAT family N-acetyltransferase n=1 Tax=Streptomyces sp. NPDC051445 TaxID=3365653 RepID=UPI00379094BE